MGNERFDISIPKEYLTRDKARLLYVSSATYGGDWISTPHTHYCSELFYVIDGVGQFQVEDNIFPVSATSTIRRSLICTVQPRAATARTLSLATPAYRMPCSLKTIGTRYPRTNFAHSAKNCVTPPLSRRAQT